MAKKKAKKKTKTKKKVFQLTWVYECFEEHESFFSKRMFGGLAVYCHGKMVMLLTESPGDREYRSKKFDFDIWNGILFPTEYDFQDQIRDRFPQLFQHPVLKKWLYLPLDTDGFEDLALELATEIRKNNKYFGIFPKMN